jgi:hypothetical protein
VVIATLPLIATTVKGVIFQTMCGGSIRFTGIFARVVSVMIL